MSCSCDNDVRIVNAGDQSVRIQFREPIRSVHENFNVTSAKFATSTTHTRGEFVFSIDYPY
jgi:hypothetical protein